MARLMHMTNLKKISIQWMVGDSNSWWSVSTQGFHH